MSENKNAALRIKHLLEKATNTRNNSVADSWKSVFDIDVANNNKLFFEVSSCLNLLHGEIEFLRREMSETNYSSYLYDPVLDRVNQIIDLHAINSSWEPYRTQITPDIILCLGFCSEILPSDEKEIAEEEIKEIHDLLGSLEISIADSNLSSYTKRIIHKHITKIKEALMSYAIVGARAFNEVVQAAYGEVIDNITVFEESKDKPEVSNLVKIWQKIKVVSDNAVIIEKGLSASQKITEYTSKAIEYIQELAN